MRILPITPRRPATLPGALILALALTIPVSCGGDPTAPPPTGGATSITVTAGGTQSKTAGSASDDMRLRVTKDGAAVANATVLWTTSGGQLQATSSTTDADGVTTNKLTTVGSAAGTVTVTAVSSGANATFTVTVSAAAAGPATSLDYGPDFVVVEPGTTSTALTAVLRDAAGAQVTSTVTPTYTSRTTAVATVSATGQVTAVAAGQSVVVASVVVDGTTFTDSLLAIVPIAGGPVVMTDLGQISLKTDTTFTIALFANMRASTEKIASGKVTLTWDPTVITYQSHAEGASNVGATVNANNAATGSLVLAFASSAGFSGKVELRKITFKASATAAKKGMLTIATNEMFAVTGFADLLPKTVSVLAPIYTR